jgi:3-isopropylmalate dehydrogenase
MSRIAIIPGDGIGPEVTAEAVRALSYIAERDSLGLEMVSWELGAERYLREGVALTDGEFAELESDFDAILLGALGDPRVPDNAHMRDILLRLRFGLDLYLNHRPAYLSSPGLSPLAGMEGRTIELDIVRENTEGIYVNMGGRFKIGTPDEIAIHEDLNTRKGVERIVRAAFDIAARRGRKRVTMVDKANAMPSVGALWRAVFASVGEEFPGIATDTMLVDAMAMDLVRRPERYEVLAPSNLFGDILSDVAAIVTGGLGLAASANLNPGRHAMFEPVHGSAPDIQGTGQANPLAAIRCAALLLDYLGHETQGAEVEAAVVDVISSGPTTPDLGGTATTGEVGSAVMARLAG